MKNKIVSTFSIITFFFFMTAGLLLPDKSFAQVSINNLGTAPDSSAILDVNATNKGILVPRVALVSTSSTEPIENPTNSLLLYNTASINDVTPGFYFWDSINFKWTSLKNIQHGAGNIAFMFSGDPAYLLKTDGTVWKSYSINGPFFEQINGRAGQLPVPLSDVVLWHYTSLVDKNGNFWYFDIHSGTNNIWYNFGPLP